VKPYYEDESVKIFRGDCRDVLPTLDIVDHVLTDPPYARDVYQRLRSPNTHKGSGTPARMGIRNHQYSSVSIEKLAAGAIGSINEMLSVVALEIARLTRRWALVFSDAESIQTWRGQLESAGMRYVRTGAWFKPDPMPQFSGDRPAVGFEPCTICHAQGPMRWNGGGSAATWTYGTVKKNRPDHPCPKPIGLMLELVNLFSDPDETILDPFVGSGTTLVAAKQLGRKGIGIEVDEKFCEVAAERLRAATRQLSISFSGEQQKLEATA
jgi:DNA modification methylase